MPHELPKAYEPENIERRWAEYWVEEHLFDQPSRRDDPRAAFTMLLPPPNVTGRLHMGHMLNQTEMDILARWHRMLGERALWIPGTDHAGIATQMMVERQLRQEGTGREEMGREAFVERVWQWKRLYGGTITEQMRRLGASVDWSREYFTMDEKLSAAVREAFVRLYEQGLVYRGAYIVNWCPGCLTAISDLEVVHEEQQGHLWHIRYPVVENPGEFLTIATTRPETMPGDVAVAVHPEDGRYLHLHGKHLRLPLTGREIPVVTDAWVNPEFGTGAVKVTPAHDANDFAIGQRHGLPAISVIDETARMTAQAGPFAGLDRYQARRRIVAELQSAGLVAVVEPHTHAVGLCDRSRDVVEPRLSMQWFIRIQPLADKAIAAVEQGYIRFTPDNYAKTYFQWMRNIHDWCISRQLWWGHRIPAWHCSRCQQVTVARETPAACAGCGGSELSEENDVLDTWFSSGLLPFTSLGWPQRTADLETFYPTELLVTGFDILFFWVARMIMLGCHFMLDVPMADGSERLLENAVPFREVYIHALVRDADRQKMSKTKGNVIDPIDVVSRFGTDAVRYTLASMAAPGTDIAFNEARTEGYRAFANKIWNAARFLFLQIDRAAEAGLPYTPSGLGTMPQAPAGAPLEDRWIVSRLHRTAGEVNAALGEYRFDEAARVIYQFFWGDYCDWYLEAVKPRLDFSQGGNPALAQPALDTLVGVFEAALRLLSPFMPFLTEELWHALYDQRPPGRSIALERFPLSDAACIEAGAEAAMATLQQLITHIRELRKSSGAGERTPLPVQIRCSRQTREMLAANGQLLEKLARVSSLEFVSAIASEAVMRSTPELDVAIVYEKQIDAAAERERLGKERARLEKELGNAERQLANEGFLAKAPGDVVAALRRKQAENRLLLEKVEAGLAALGAGR